MPFFAHANFNPRAPYGARLSRRPWARWPPHFNPRAPYGARRPDRWRSCGPAYFNPRAPYGARLQVQILIRTDKIISIHAPHTGRDWLMVPGILYTWEFQSTRPIRGATRSCWTPAAQSWHFNPRAPYGARHRNYVAPRLTELFQSTRPIRGATGDVCRLHSCADISIHAPHTGRDFSRFWILCSSIQFQSTRPIRGATTPTAGRPANSRKFQSTRPIRGATTTRPHSITSKEISIHAPHTGRDSKNA